MPNIYDFYYMVRGKQVNALPQNEAPLIGHWVGQHWVSGEIYHGLWFDIGSMARLHAAQQAT